MLTNEFRIARVEKTQRWFEQDIALLNGRVRERSKQGQESAGSFGRPWLRETGRNWTARTNNDRTMKTRARLPASPGTETEALTQS